MIAEIALLKFCLWWFHVGVVAVGLSSFGQGLFARWLHVELYTAGQFDNKRWRRPLSLGTLPCEMSKGAVLTMPLGPGIAADATAETISEQADACRSKLNKTTQRWCRSSRGRIHPFPEWDLAWPVREVIFSLDASSSVLVRPLEDLMGHLRAVQPLSSLGVFPSFTSQWATHERPTCSLPPTSTLLKPLMLPRRVLTVEGLPQALLSSCVAGALYVMALEVKMLINPVSLRDGE